MFTIEHDFEATIITLIDEGTPFLQGDITINAFQDCITVEQVDPQTDRLQRITISMTQLQELQSALNLPEGSYRVAEDPE
ncbi:MULTISPECIES: hypothetical protein [Falsihalocynthiibacter]|uniref:Phosphomannomutase n=1 Tax=Falsihalocynthiibacter arcticus TaxID=1579316 RepID=A0A126UVF3_9RHOB|nr:hypothetical protein [Falsihalocynthiibacter arcticus]AML50038.1 hypothetical protein RC74_00960 [Falsihalocynthiibacter arcticus]